MIKHVQPVLGPADDRNHMQTEKFGFLLLVLLLPALLLGLDLPHSDRDLGRAQLDDRNGVQDRFANCDHCKFPRLWAAGKGATTPLSIVVRASFASAQSCRRDG